MDGIRLGKLQQIALVQHDVAKAVPFYRDGLGLPLQFEMNGLAFFDAWRPRCPARRRGVSAANHSSACVRKSVRCPAPQATGPALRGHLPSTAVAPPVPARSTNYFR